MAVICLGCGKDIAGDKIKRVLRSSANRHVLPLWSCLFQEIVEECRLSMDGREMAARGGRLCSKCFSALQQLNRKIAAVKADMRKAMLAFGGSPQHSENSSIPVRLNISNPSPEVMVR